MNVGDKVEFRSDRSGKQEFGMVIELGTDSVRVAVFGYGVVQLVHRVDIKITHTASYKPVYEFKPGQVWNDDNENTYFVVRSIGNVILMVDVYGELIPLSRFDPDTEWILVHDV